MQEGNISMLFALCQKGLKQKESGQLGFEITIYTFAVQCDSCVVGAKAQPVNVLVVWNLNVVVR
jgi:hypothetical protein